MKIAITGATGYIGKHLTTFLETSGHFIVPLPHSLFSESMADALVHKLMACDVVINLAGASIQNRWSSDYKKELISSRVQLTRRLVRAFQTMDHPPRLLISTSAVGYYPLTGVSDEYTTVRGSGFLSDLCVAWEEEAQHCPASMRLAVIRLGVVLSPDGGAMKQMLRPIRLGRFAVRFGDGKQPFTWISMLDLCRAISFIINHQSVCGTINMVAPQRVTQGEFTRVLAQIHGVWATIPIPAALLQLALGEQATLLTTGAVVSPTRLTEVGFHFATPTLKTLFETYQLKGNE